jgi:hypothetical protein
MAGRKKSWGSDGQGKNSLANTKQVAMLPFSSIYILACNSRCRGEPSCQKHTWNNLDRLSGTRVYPRYCFRSKKKNLCQNVIRYHSVKPKTIGALGICRPIFQNVTNDNPD